MINVIILDTAVVATVNGDIIEMNVSPFFPREKVIGRVDMTGFSGTVIIEGSDTGLFTGEETLLMTTQLQTTEDRPLEFPVILTKFVRAGTTRTAGTVDFISLKASG